MDVRATQVMQSKPMKKNVKKNLQEKFVFFFGEEIKGFQGDIKLLLGGKGAGLAEMTKLGLPVPPGFTITTKASGIYKKEGALPTSLVVEIKDYLAKLETMGGARFGDRKNPLLLSVRSGAPVSMPGMMDTILNIGLDDDTVQGLAEKTEDDRFAYDSYRRFLQMYGSVALGIEHGKFERLIESEKKERQLRTDAELPAESLKKLVSQFKELIQKEYPSHKEDLFETLLHAISAVFASWDNARAREYRRIHKISHSYGTAANVQAMVFGNMGERSATGVVFSRNPSTGEEQIYGEFLLNAQGEDVVAGIRDPFPIAPLTGSKSTEATLKDLLPECFEELVTLCHKLERHYRDMQDIEFTIQEGKLYLLQTRKAKRTAQAAAKVAVDRVKEGLITKDEAILSLSPEQLIQLLHEQIDPSFPKHILAKGLPASPGAASGKIVFDAHQAVYSAAKGERVILVRRETSPDDIAGMNASVAILTSRGGMTSHAAVVARGMGKCCVVGCYDLIVDSEARKCEIKGEIFEEGMLLTIDGSTGEVIRGAVPTKKGELSEEVKTLMEWADKRRRLRVRANADSPEDAALARAFGAEGIGLCRTEHMFFGEQRIQAVRRLIVAPDSASRREALKDILELQKQDFIGIFKNMDNLPVTIRLLDPPLHEFLPKREEDIVTLAKDLDMSHEETVSLVERMREANPMLGHRGCRLGVTHPEIYEMQMEAIIEAACTVQKNKDIRVIPEIMLPLISTPEELRLIRESIVAVAEEVIRRHSTHLLYTVGTMIELPRAALVADEIAAYADFFSFGTNDLTQTTYGISRDDAASFLQAYDEAGIFPQDPFMSLDRAGVGKLMEIAVKLGRSRKANLKLGICGEHGGDPQSVQFCHELGLDYVSCSPYRVIVARLAAAHSALNG